MNNFCIFHIFNWLSPVVNLYRVSSGGRGSPPYIRYWLSHTDLAILVGSVQNKIQLKTVMMLVFILLLNLLFEVFTARASHCQTLQCLHGTCTNGNCVCEPGWHGDYCEFREDRAWNCTTKGVIGNNCERCDEMNFYFGNPTDSGSCFYKLTIDFQFTFNLSKPEDRRFNQINFMITPPKPDIDTDFTLSCSVDASVNVTVKTATKAERVLLSNQPCSIKQRFSHNEYSFGSGEDTTFFVYVYNFQTPMWTQVAFSQYPKIDLLSLLLSLFRLPA